MILRLGNLTVAQFMERVGGDATPGEVAELEAARTDEANFTDPTRFHIFDDPGISIVIGADCLTDTLPVWQRINARRPFNREVGFYPAGTTSPNTDSRTEPK